jgi:hypothetical protein
MMTAVTARRLRPLTWGALVLLTTATGTFAFASPAAAVAGLQYMTATSAFDSTSPKTLVLTCPGGRAVIGGGAHLTGALGQATMRQIEPIRVNGIGALRVIAEEDPDGFAGSWMVSAAAVCIAPPAGLRYVRVSATDPGSAWATAGCGRDHVIGGGYVASETAAVKAAGIETDARNRAYVSTEPSRVPGALVPVTSTAIAVCASVPLPGQTQVTVATPENSADGKTAIATCPVGTQVIGIGGDLYGFRAHTVIDDFQINTAGNQTILTGYEDQAGNPDNWAAQVWAHCAA